MMRLFQVWNTSSHWWVIAPNEEVAIDYSFAFTSTKEKKNLHITKGKFYTADDENFYPNELHKDNLKELLEGDRVGIVIRSYRQDTGSIEVYWRFTISNRWIFEKHDWCHWTD